MARRRGCRILVIVLYVVIQQVAGLTMRLGGSSNYAVLGQTFRFTCTVTNDENPSLGTVGFLKSGESSVCTVFPSCIESPTSGYSCGCVSGQSNVYYLDMSSVRLQDDGTWICSKGSMDSSNLVLPVYYGPGQVTLDRSSPQTVVESSTLTVDCSTSCKPCSYVWKKGTSTASSSRTLRLTNINRNQAGDYVCTATNTGTGTSASSPTLTVVIQYRPEVSLDTPSGTSSCRPYRVYVGQQNVQLTCRVTAANPAVTSYIWTLSGSTIPSAASSVYTLSPVSRSSRGSYTCAGRNSVGVSSSPSSLQVDVQYVPLVLLPGSWTVIEGQALSVKCSVESNHTVTLTWTRKGGGSFTTQTGSTLTIPIIQRSQSGTYVCTATDTLSPCSGVAPPTPVSKEVTVDVQYPPSLSGEASSYPVTEFSALQINCSRYTSPGNPLTMQYGWKGPNRFNFNGPVLSISSINRNQTGQYTCTATNTLSPTGGPSQTGTATGSFNVDVQYIPPTPTELLAWSVDSNVIKLSWRTVLHGGVPIHFIVQYKEEGHQWTEMDKHFTENGDNYVQGSISGLKPQTLYFIRVKSENTFGSSRFTVETRVLTKGLNQPDSLKTSSVSSTVMLGVGIFLVVVGTAVFAGACLYIKRKGFRNRNRSDEHYASMGTKENNAYDELNIHEYKNMEHRGETRNTGDGIMTT